MSSSIKRILAAWNRASRTRRFVYSTALIFPLVLLWAMFRLLPPEQQPFDSHRDLRDSLPVFPGAEGFGTDTQAGRRGTVLRVTTLADSGPGSLR